jgi:hypothetical protein
MSKYSLQPFDLSSIRTYPLKDRPSKVDVRCFGRPHVKGGSVADFLRSLPDFLGAQALRNLAQAMVQARSVGKPILWGLGGHVVKTGLSTVLIDLMDRGLISAIAMNGAGVIHDFEIALIGSTSEDVEAQLEQGAFGMAEETGRDINLAISDGVANGLGIGESLGRYLSGRQPQFGEFSLLLQAYARSIPVTVHVTIGADIIHNHPSCSPSDIGEASHRDFRLFASLVAGLNGGGVYLNCGSAVTLPEVFLKCITLVRNSGSALQDFTTANLDLYQHYRPRENVLKRPLKKGGVGIPITGHHEILLPLLAAWLVELSPRTRSDE